MTNNDDNDNNGSGVNITRKLTPKLVPALLFSIAVLIISGAIAVPFLTITWAQQQQNMTSSTAPNNATTTATATAAKPVDGYEKPEGHLTAIRHLFDDPSLRVHHYCKPNDKILLVCQLYDSDSANATLIGIEYIISADQYNSLPDREKPGWHYHKIEFATNRADARFPDLSTQQAGQSLRKLADTYGKVVIAWDPKDKLPSFPPQVEMVQHPFMVNSTVTPEMHKGSFNQTLKY